jgi:hypothetical protein
MALQSEQPRGRVSYQTLVHLCVDSYAAHIIDNITKEVQSDDSDCWNRAMQLAEYATKRLCSFFRPFRLALVFLSTASTILSFSLFLSCLFQWDAPRWSIEIFMSFRTAIRCPTDALEHFNLNSTFSKQIEHMLPLEFTRHIAKLTLRRSSLAGFIIASRLSSSLQCINLNRLYDPRAFPPPAVVSTLLSHFAEGLHRVHLHGSYVDDDAIKVLSLSPAAKTIRELHFAQSYISDASAHVWLRFSALQILELSECNLLDASTYAALAKHQLLESLSFTLHLAGALPASAIVPILLQPDALPSLTSLNAISGDPAHSIYLNDLVALVRRRPNREQFRQLRYAKQNGDPIDLLVELHRMCPNLEVVCDELRPPHYPPPPILLEHLHNIRELKDEELTLNSEEDLFAVADRFCHLESLYLQRDGVAAFPGFPFANFASFTSLKALFLTSSVVAPLELPACLRRLDFTVPTDHLASIRDDQVNALCLSICSSAPHLKYLTLNLPGSSLNRTHAVLLLNRLVRLKHLSLDGSAQEIAVLELEICHPNLSYLDVSCIRLSPVPRWWPNRTSFELRGHVEPMLKMLTLRAPNLESVNAWLLDRSGDQPAVLTFLDAIRRFDGKIVSLSLDTHSHVLDLDSFKSLLSLRHLSQLELRNLPLTQENAQTLVSTMPLLTRLDLNFVPLTPDISWVKLGLLRFLTLILGASKQTDPDPNYKCDPDLVVLHPANVPLLAELVIKSMSPIISGFQLTGFENLGELEVTSGPGFSASYPLDISVSKCNRLFRISIRNTLLRSLRLSELPALMGIGFRTCLLHEDSTLNISECPRLRSCESCKYRAKPAGVEKCLQLEEVIRLQVADVQHFKFT